MQKADSTILALDVGERRIGVAIAHSVARLARPLTTLQQHEGIWEELIQLITDEGVEVIVVGLPRNLSGEHTAQTNYTEDFVRRLREATDVSIVMQDEALTSKQAEKELLNRGKPYTKEAVDALAATYILEDYLNSKKGVPSW